MAQPTPYDFAAGPTLPAAEQQALQERVTAQVTDAASQLGAIIRRDLTGELDRLGLADGPAAHGERYLILHGADHLGELVAPHGSVVGLADLIMGGLGWVEHRRPTELELTLVTERLRGFVTVVLRALDENIHAVELVPAEDEPLPAGGVLQITLGIVGPAERYPLSIHVPVTSEAEPEVQEVSPAAEVAAAFSLVPVTVSLRFSPVAVTAADLTELCIGDVIRLDHTVDEPLVGVVDDRPLFNGRLGRCGRRAAVEIIDLIERSGT